MGSVLEGCGQAWYHVMGTLTGLQDRRGGERSDVRGKWEELELSLFRAAPMAYGGTQARG